MTAHPAPSCRLCQDLMQYCAQDVWATYEVFQQQLPLFLEGEGVPLLGTPGGPVGSPVVPGPALARCRWAFLRLGPSAFLAREHRAALSRAGRWPLDSWVSRVPEGRTQAVLIHGQLSALSEPRA